jgi:hypothetical protein
MEDHYLIRKCLIKKDQLRMFNYELRMINYKLNNP